MKATGLKMIGQRLGNWQRATAYEYRLHVVLRMAASTLRQSDSYFGGTISPTETEVGHSRGDQGYGGQARTIDLSPARYGTQFVDQGAEGAKARLLSHVVLQFGDEGDPLNIRNRQ